MLGKGPKTQSRRPTSPRRGNPIPPWLVFLLGVAIVFGIYYLWLGVRDFIASGGLGIAEATEQTILIETATAELIINTQQAATQAMEFTPAPTFTPIPECIDFIVTVPRAIVRAAPSTDSVLVDSWVEGTSVCVISRAPSASDWYLIDYNPQSRRINEAYMFEDIIQAINPTPTPTTTPTQAPTVTQAPTRTPSITPTPAPSATRNPDLTNTPTPTPTRTPTLPVQSA